VETFACVRSCVCLCVRVCVMTTLLAVGPIIMLMHLSGICCCGSAGHPSSDRRSDDQIATTAATTTATTTATAAQMAMMMTTTAATMEAGAGTDPSPLMPPCIDTCRTVRCVRRWLVESGLCAMGTETRTQHVRSSQQRQSRPECRQPPVVVRPSNTPLVNAIPGGAAAAAEAAGVVGAVGVAVGAAAEVAAGVAAGVATTLVVAAEVAEVAAEMVARMAQRGRPVAAGGAVVGEAVGEAAGMAARARSSGGRMHATARWGNKAARRVPSSAVCLHHQPECTMWYVFRCYVQMQHPLWP
jgi:hypothetical protein